MSRRIAGADESTELRRLREGIDTLDRQIVDLPMCQLLRCHRRPPECNPFRL